MTRRFSLDDEGVTHYQLRFQKAKPVSPKLITEINSWRGFLHTFGWIGQDPKRYRGIGFGNISRRLKKGCLVSGTQTGRMPHLTHKHYSTVLKAFPEKNVVHAKGPLPPSSESMTHAQIYSLDPSANVVIHVHSPLLWKAAARLKMPTTPHNVPYGTPEMAAAVERLYHSGRLSKAKIFAMAGHRDGVVSFGVTADEAGLRLMQYAQLALRSNKR